jgi:hypothetical protein
MAHVIASESVPFVERRHVREGTFRSKRLVEGVPGTAGNFSLQLVHTPNGYYAPRHRHNFDQIRYQIEGDFDFDSDGTMRPGAIAYFPEGTPYGPQSSTGSSLTLVLQHGGASRSGYISAEQYERAMGELAAIGSFAKGVFTRKDAGQRLNKDAYQAIWEHVNGRPLVYPAPRYARPVFMWPDAFDWVPVAGAPGVDGKRLGEFSECRTRLALFRIARGRTLLLEPNALYFVLRGSGRADGMAFAPQAVIDARAEGHASVTAETETELLLLGLPQLA